MQKGSSNRMWPFCFFIIVLTACSSKSPAKGVKPDGLNSTIDTCSLNNLHIDTKSVETQAFKKFWQEAKRLGYTFRDDTIVPFVKVIFHPRSEKFYIDTFTLKDCSVLDGVNIHRMEIQSRKPIQQNYFPNLIAEEWEFKSAESANIYAKAWAAYIGKGYGVKSPTVIVYQDSAVYMFQTAAYMFIPEMGSMVKLLVPNGQILGQNY